MSKPACAPGYCGQALYCQFSELLKVIASVNNIAAVNNISAMSAVSNIATVNNIATVSKYHRHRRIKITWGGGARGNWTQSTIDLNYCLAYLLKISCISAH